MPTVSFGTRGIRGVATTRSSLVSAATGLPFAEAQRRRSYGRRHSEQQSKPTSGQRCRSGRFADLSFVKALAAKRDAAIAKDCSVAGFGEAVVSTDLLSGVAELILLHEVEVVSGQEAF